MAMMQGRGKPKPKAKKIVKGRPLFGRKPKGDNPKDSPATERRERKAGRPT